jgi:hypothetical protein
MIGWVYFTEGSAVADADTTGVPALWAHVPTDEGVLLPTTVMPALLFPAQFFATWPMQFSPSHFFWLAVLS